MKLVRSLVLTLLVAIVVVGAQTTQIVGTGSPEGAYSAGPGSVFVRTDGPPNLYIKESGAGNTGWQPAVSATGTRARVACSSSNYAVLAIDSFIALTGSGPQTLTLPSGSAVGAGATYTFVDEANNAASNNKTIQRSGSDTFAGGGTSVVIDCDGGAVTVYWTGGAWKIR